jgi:hypothetical protein
MEKQMPPYLDNPPTTPSYPQPIEADSHINRVTGNILCYVLIVVCTAAIPFINLMLFYFQPFELGRIVNVSNPDVTQGRSDDFTYFYIVMGMYCFVTTVFVSYSCFFTTLWERAKLYAMVDNILITMLAADVAYAALHVVTFTATYSTDDEYNFVPEFILVWQDILVIALYCLTNLAMIGIFRILMVNIYWRPYQVIVYKLAIVFSSLIYIAVGLVYIFGDDSLSKQVDEFNLYLDQFID